VLFAAAGPAFHPLVQRSTRVQPTAREIPPPETASQLPPKPGLPKKYRTQTNTNPYYFTRSTIGQ
jgi:hypothetical protein